MRLAILFWFYKEFDLCVERLALLRRFNPHTPIYGLYGGDAADAEQARRVLGAQLDDWYEFRADVDGRWRWLHGDQLIAAWFRERGRDLPWDTVVVAQWDHLFLAPIGELFAGLQDGEAVFSGLRPLDDVRPWWGWAGARNDGRGERLLEFERRVRNELRYQGPLWCCLFIVACLPRRFMERYAAFTPAELGFLEYKMPTLAAAWGVPVRDFGLRPWWAADPNTKDVPARERVLNAVGSEPDEQVVLEELARPDGARIFHPVSRPMGAALRAALGPPPE